MRYVGLRLPLMVTKKHILNVLHRFVPRLEVLFSCVSSLLLLLSSWFRFSGGRCERISGDNLGREAVTALRASAIANAL